SHRTLRAGQCPSSSGCAPPGRETRSRLHDERPAPHLRHRSSTWRIRPEYGLVRSTWLASHWYCTGASSGLHTGMQGRLHHFDHACPAKMRRAYGRLTKQPMGRPVTEFLLPLTVLTFPQIDPGLLQIGPLAVHWYGLG